MRILTALLLAAAPALAQSGGWGPATRVTQVSTIFHDTMPDLSQDGLTLRWSSARTDLPGFPGGGSDFYEAVRPHRYAPFGPASLVPGGFSTPGVDVQCHVWGSETMAWVVNNSLFNHEIFEVTRPGPASPWGFPVAVAAFSSPGQDRSPTVTADGLLALFTSHRSGNWEVYESQRPGVGHPWSVPVLVPSLSSASHEFEVCVSPDGLTCYLSRDVGGVGDLHRSTRKLRTDPWSAPAPVAGVNSPQLDNGPSIAADGRELWFDSTRFGNVPDIYVARWTGLSHQNLPRPGQPLLIHLTLPAQAAQSYLVGVALSSTPGIPVPGVGTIPLAPDPLFLLSIGGQLPSVFSGFAGVIDLNGEATATLNVPAGVLAGLDFSIAAITHGPSGVTFITNGEDLKINP